MKNDAPIFNPLRGMSSTLASNIINVLGANSDFIELANNNSHITGIYDYLIGQEIPDKDYVDFFTENQFDIINFLSSKHVGLKGLSRNITNYIEYRHQTITKQKAGKNQKVPCFHNAELTKTLYGRQRKYSNEQIEYIKFLYADCLAYLVRSYKFHRKGLSQASIVTEFFDSLVFSKKAGCVLNGAIAGNILDIFGGVEGFISAVDDRADGYKAVKMDTSMREYFYTENRGNISEVFENIRKKSNYSSIVEAVHAEVADQSVPVDHVAIGIYEESDGYRFSSSAKMIFIDIFVDYLMRTTMDLFNDFLREREAEQGGVANV